MIVECPDCGSRYRIEDGKIPSSGGRVSCPSCDYSFIVWPGGETAELASADPSGGGGAESEDESTAVANAEEIRKQVEQSVAGEETGGQGGQSEQRKADPSTAGGQQGPVGQRESSSVGAKQASSQSEESNPQEGGIPDFLEEAMDGTDEEGTVEMENPFLDDDGSMSVPEDLQAEAEGVAESSGGESSGPVAPGPETSGPSAPGSKTEEADREDLPDLSQGDPNATNPVPLEERQPSAGAQQDQETSGESSGFEDATQEISDPSSLVDDDEDADELFGGDLFGDESNEPSEPATEELDRGSQPVGEQDAGGRSRQETPVSGQSAAMQDQQMELDRQPSESSSPESAPAAPSPTGESEAPKTDELASEDVPDLADDSVPAQSGPADDSGAARPGPEAQRAGSGSDGMGEPVDRSQREGRQGPGGGAPPGLTGGAQTSSSAQARAQSQEQAQADEQEVSRLLVAVFVLLLAIFFVLLAGALGMFDLRKMLPGLSSAAAAQHSGQAVVAEEGRAVQQDSIEPMVRAGETSLEANRLYDALRHFKTAKMAAPESPRVHRLLAKTYRRLGQSDRASSHRLRAMRLNVDGEEMTNRRATTVH